MVISDIVLCCGWLLAIEIIEGSNNEHYRWGKSTASLLREIARLMDI